MNGHLRLFGMELIRISIGPRPSPHIPTHTACKQSDSCTHEHTPSGFEAHTVGTCGILLYSSLAEMYFTG
jgi:hypothetical protein